MTIGTMNDRRGQEELCVESRRVVYTLFEVLKRAAICSGAPRST